LKGHGGNILFFSGMAIGLLVVLAVASSALPVGVAPIKPISVADNSMTPTFTRGMLVVAHWFTRPIQHDDLVVYTPREGVVIPGRVVGLPGDTVQVTEGALLVNGDKRTEPYVRDPMNFEMIPVYLGDNQYFILGDNRNQSSEDSHVHGPIAGSQVLGELWTFG